MDRLDKLARNARVACCHSTLAGILFAAALFALFATGAVYWLLRQGG